MDLTENDSNAFSLVNAHMHSFWLLIRLDPKSNHLKLLLHCVYTLNNLHVYVHSLCTYIQTQIHLPTNKGLSCITPETHDPFLF